MRISAPLLFLLFSQTVLAGYTVSEIYGFAGEKLCFPNGQVEFTVIQHKASRPLDDIKGVGFKFNNSRTYTPINGTWYDESYRPIRVFRRGEPAIFVSSEDIFEKQGTYTIMLADQNISSKALMQLNYYTGENTLEDGSGIKFNVECPGASIFCEPADLTLECVNVNDSLVLSFQGVDGTGVDIHTGIEYMLDYQVLEGRVSYVGLPNSTTINRVGADSYIIRIPSADIELPVERVKLSIKDCNELLFYSSILARCSNMLESNVANMSEDSRNDVQTVVPAPADTAKPAVPDEPAPSVEVPKDIPEPVDAPKSWFSRLWGWFASLFS